MKRSLSALLDELALTVPSVFTEIEGATREEIDAFASVCGHPLPPAYREYLELMGRRDGGMLINARDVHVDPAYLTKYYREAILTGEEALPADTILIATGSLTIENLCLESGEQGRVWHAVGEDKTWLWAGSFAGLLYRNVFHRLLRCRLPYVWYSARTLTSVVGAVREEALRDGYALEWFSDDVAICARSGDSMLFAEQMEGEHPEIMVGSRDRARGDALVERVGAQFGVKFWGGAS